MEVHRFQTPQVTPIGGWGPAAKPAWVPGHRASSTPDVTLQLTPAEARRIVRALEQTSLSICASPNASRLAGTYMRLAGTVRRQVEVV